MEVDYAGFVRTVRDVDPNAVAALGRHLSALASSVGVEAPGCEVRRNRGLASVTKTSDEEAATVIVDRQVLDADVNVQDTILGHEIAHILLGHHLVKAVSRPRLAVCGALLAVALASALAGLAMGPQGRWLSALTLLSSVLTLSTMAIFGVVSRPREFAADRVAYECFGVRFNEELAGWMAHHGGKGPGLLAFLSTHPSHRQRIKAVRSFGQRPA
jgi:Zn-dependent protease with chaperone function